MTVTRHRSKRLLLLILLPFMTGVQTLVNDGRSITHPNGLKIELPTQAKSIHFIQDDFILVREASRFRFLLSESSNSAILRTVPIQLPRAEFKGATSGGQMLIFEAGSSREEIDIRALRNGMLRSEIRGSRSATPLLVNERLMTPPSTLFWEPPRPPGSVGPGHGLRAEVVAAFSTPRANESIEEYEPVECVLPPHSTNRNGPSIQEPTRTQVFKHLLRDRKGNQFVFFTALDSREVTYLTKLEATVRGCEASYQRRRGGMLHSWDLSRKVHQPEYLVRLELRDAGVPAEGVLVRLFELRNIPGSTPPDRPLCGYSNARRILEPGPTDGLTLANGSFAWKSERSQQRSRGRRRYSGFMPNTVFAVVCIRTDADWIPIWHSARESSGYLLKCDLATRSEARCQKIQAR